MSVLLVVRVTLIVGAVLVAGPSVLILVSRWRQERHLDRLEEQRRGG